MISKSVITILAAVIFLITPFSAAINISLAEVTGSLEGSQPTNTPRTEVEFDLPWRIVFVPSSDEVEIWASSSEETYPLGTGTLGWVFLSQNNQKLEGSETIILSQSENTKLISIGQLPNGIGQLRAWIIINEVVGEAINEIEVLDNHIIVLDPNTNPEGELKQTVKPAPQSLTSTLGMTTPIPEITSSFTPLSTKTTNGRSVINISYDADSLPSNPWQGGIGTNASGVGWGVSNYTYTQGSGALWSAGYNYNNSTSRYCTSSSCQYENDMYTGVYASISLATYTNATNLNLTFDTNYSLESGYDFFEIYAAINSTSWVQVGNYSGNSNGWTSANINLINYSGNSNFELYFIMTSDISINNYPGVFIDNILISGNVSSVTNLPDLVPTGIWGPSTVQTGNSYTITSSISNIGTAQSGTFSWSAYLYDSTNYTHLVTTYNSNLNSNVTTNQTSNITIPSTITPGTYYWVLYADSYNSVSESNESNNVITGGSLTITSSSTNATDIIAQSISVASTSSSTLCTGSNISLTRAFTTNPNTTTSFEYAIYLSTNNIISTGDTQIYNYSSSWTSSNGSITITIPSTISTGTYYIGLIVDPSNSVNETNETNNWAVSNSTISVGYPDLEATDISGPSATTPGSSVTIYRDFENSGCVVSPSFRYGVYLSTNNYISTSDTLVSNRSFSGLSAGSGSSQSVTFNLPSSISTGTYYWGIIIDPYDLISESDEGNNHLAANSSLTITGSGYVTVQAKLQYYNYYLLNNSACGTSCYSEARFMKAELWDEDTVSSDDLLATGYLDSNGYIQFSNIVVSEIGTNQDIYIKFYAYNAAAEVSTASGSSNGIGTVYTWKTATVSNVASGIYSYGTQSITSNGGAMNIANAMLDSRDYANGYGSSTISQIDVIWPNGASTGAYYYWVPSVHIVLYDGFGATVIFHEYGHYVDDYYASHTGGGGPHSFNGCTSEALGWGEGWASYFAISVKDEYNYLDPTWYKDWYEYEEGLFSTYRNYNSAGDATVNNPSNGTHWDCLEEIVTGVLWDIHDGTDDDSWDTDGFGDTLGSYNQQYAQTIWNSALNYNPGHAFTLADFTYSFLTNNPSAKEEYFDILVDHAIRPEIDCNSTYSDAGSAGGDAGGTTSTSKSLYFNGTVNPFYTFHGCLTSSSDNTDYYEIIVPAGKEVQTTLVSPANNDYDISILNSTGSSLAYSTNTLGMEWVNWSSTSNISQTVYLKIERFSGSGSMYGFTVNFTNKTLPDLVASWIQGPSIINPGGSVSITRSISNIGGPAGAFSYAIYLSTDSTITTSDTLVYSGSYSAFCSNCNSNTSLTVQISNSLVAGQIYYWGLYVDIGNGITETIVSNNYYTGEQTTVGCSFSQNDGGGGGDFANNISAAYWISLTQATTFNGCMDENDDADYLYLWMESGHDLDVKLTYTNSADFDISLRYYSNSTVIDYSASSGNIDWVSTTGTSASGNANYIVINLIQFSGAGNYSLDIWVNATYQPDIAPVYLDGSGWVNPGQTTVLWRQFINYGKLNSGSFNYSIYLSTDESITSNDYLIGNYSQSVGISYNDFNYTNIIVAIPSSIPSGTYYWGIIVDGDNTVSEYNESNNNLYGGEVEVLACNYQQNDAGQGSDAPSWGSGPYMSVNAGSITGCLDYDDVQDTFTITTGPDTRIEVTLTSPSGSTFQIYLVDSTGFVVLGNSTINGQEASLSSVQSMTYDILLYNYNYEMGGDYTLTVNIIQLADLSISSLLVPNVAQAGSYLNLSFMIENTGSAESQPFSIDIFLSKDHYIDSSDELISTFLKGTISSGQQSPHSQNILLDEDLIKGPYYLCVLLNPDGLIDESQYWNNWDCKGIYIETPEVTTPFFTTQDYLITNQSSYQIDWNTSTSVGISVPGYYVILNGLQLPIMSGTTSIIPLSEGINYLEVYAVNAIGTISESDYLTITLDTILPSSPNLPYNTSISGIPGMFSLSKPHCTDNIGINSTWVESGTGWTIISLDKVTLLLESGITDVEFRCQDLAGNLGPISSIEVTTDLNPPSAPIIYGPEGWVSIGLQTFSVNQTNDVGTGVAMSKYSINGGFWQTISDDKVELWFVSGNHTIEFKSIDFAGNSGNITSVSLNIDEIRPTAPEIEIEPYHDTVKQIIANLSSPAESGSGHSHYLWSLNGGAESLENSNTINLGSLAEGTYVLSVISMDGVGNPSVAAKARFVVDNTGPNMPQIHCPTDWQTSNDITCVVGNPYDNASGIMYLQMKTQTSPWKIIELSEIQNSELSLNLADGQTDISFRWTDNLGLVSPIVNQTIRIDTVSPVIVITQNGIIDQYVADKSLQTIIANLTIKTIDNGSGIAIIVYSMDGGVSWTQYSDQGGIAAPNGMKNQQIVEFIVTDNAGNQATSTFAMEFIGDDPELITDEQKGVFSDANNSLIYGGALTILLFVITMVIYRKKTTD